MPPQCSIKTNPSLEPACKRNALERRAATTWYSVWCIPTAMNKSKQSPSMLPSHRTRIPGNLNPQPHPRRHLPPLHLSRRFHRLHPQARRHHRELPSSRFRQSSPIQRTIQSSENEKHHRAKGLLIRIDSNCCDEGNDSSGPLFIFTTFDDILGNVKSMKREMP